MQVTIRKVKNGFIVESWGAIDEVMVVPDLDNAIREVYRQFEAKNEL